MKRLVFLIALFATALGVFAGQAVSHHRASAYVLPGEGVFPEGIAYERKTGHFFVSGAGNGAIYRGHVKDDEASLFLPPGTFGQFEAIGVETGHGKLFVAGGFTGRVSVFDAETAAAIRVFESGPGGFLNDLIRTRDGDVYITDSTRPTLWRVAKEEIGPGAPGVLEPWLDLTGTAFEHVAGQFNANGIVATPDGDHLIVSNLFTGKLYRITVKTKEVKQIDLGGTLVFGDGIELLGHTLYAVGAGSVTKVRLSGHLLSGVVKSQTIDPSFAFPTTAAIARDRLLVVNSQFDQLGGTPVLPFTVSSIRLP
jgi:Cu-Zn family superoxide dismutase